MPNMFNYAENISAADKAVKMCRINVNAAARNIREMALNNDTSSYNDYELTVEKNCLRMLIPSFRL